MSIDPTKILRDERGRFAGYASSESSSSVLDHNAANDKREARARALAGAGYVPPVATKTSIAATTTADREKWWAISFSNAEYGHEAGDRLAMPDDYTPNMTGGQAITGHRRTHRMNYNVAEGVSVRMPSKTSVKRFAAEHHNRTFDVPVSATIDGRNVSGWVRVTKGGDGQWDAQGVGFPSSVDEVRIAESVSMTLEGQRARVSRTDAAALARHRAERLKAGGAREDRVQSGWIKSSSYTPVGNSGRGRFTMTTKDYTRKDGTVRPGRSYVGEVSESTYHQFIGSDEPGKFFNEKMKGRASIDHASTCPKCGLVSKKPHQGDCPTARQSRRMKKDNNRDNMRAFAALLAGKKKK